jgi:uroporphyrin-III C-methyltransferase/precorrin-2 dehydrogenase/sirohydrochlorin ferrochelatase
MEEDAMQYFPAFMKLEGGACLIVGGAGPALVKLRLLEKGTAAIRVVAPLIIEEIRALAVAGRIDLCERPFETTDVQGQSLVFATTGKAEVDTAVSRAAKGAGVPVNVVDNSAASSFITPAIVDRDPVVVAISSAGTAPVLARQIRAQLEAMLPAELGRLARFAESFRSAVKATVPGFSGRRRFWEGFFAGPLARKVLAGAERQAREDMLSLINRSQGDRPRGSVALVGAGPGDPELLTLKAQRLLQSADLVVYDRLVNPAILEHTRRDAERLYVGKAKGEKSKSQQEIHQLMLQALGRGRQVVRLKGGDPFVFGRGGEELDFLEAAGFTVQVVPGITAATGCAAATQIPLTHRGLAQSVTFVTGHGQAGEPELDWASLARLDGTLCFYMGVSTAANIAGSLLDEGLASSTPVAVVENGTLTEQRCLRGRLDGLPDLIARERVEAPALIIIGAVARSARAAELPALADAALAV